ncbi:MAG: IS4 family transposase [Verrucomicrobiae bacterium]|nr:IS4 family transposase [Verrucomicrobiae bacterium]
MSESIVVCRREFHPEVLEHLNALTRQEPPPTRNMLAREVCAHLAWYSPDGRAATSSAKVALRKLERRGVLRLPERAMRSAGRHRLRRSDQPLPALAGVPSRVDQIRALQLHLIAGPEDPRHGLWNDLIIEQHPCGDAPLVGTQLRYLIGSEHGWLGALGFGPAAFVLASRDQWIGWSVGARLGHLRQVVGLSRLLIRQEVRCANLVSKVLSLVLARLPEDWHERYRVRPLLVETYVDRSQFKGLSLSVSNWLRVGVSSGRGRLGTGPADKTLKDVWLYPLHGRCRQQLQEEVPAPLTPRSVEQNLAQAEWCEGEMGGVDLGDRRRKRRAVNILAARWQNPSASFYGSFSDWSPAKGAYGLIEHKGPEISLASLLSAHQETTQRRMAAEAVVLLAQDTTSLNYSGLRQTTGLGPLGEARGHGLWVHSLLALRPDGVPLGVLDAQCWGREPVVTSTPRRGRNAKSIDEKESYRWVQMYQQAAAAARRMPQTQLVVMADREGDLYELHQAAPDGPPNLHPLVRAQHNRNLVSHQKLWAHMAALPCGHRRTVEVPRRAGQPARTAAVEVRWDRVEITPPAVGCKRSWPPAGVWVVWVQEPNPPAGVEPLDWMLLSDLPVPNAQAAWQRVEWYCRRWTIEEWHRVLKSGCGVEQREFRTAEHLQRVLAFDLIVAWRVLACVKVGRAMPQLPATVLYTLEELEVLRAASKKKASCHRHWS